MNRFTPTSRAACERWLRACGNRRWACPWGSWEEARDYKPKQDIDQSFAGRGALSSHGAALRLPGVLQSLYRIEMEEAAELRVKVGVSSLEYQWPLEKQFHDHGKELG